MALPVVVIEIAPPDAPAELATVLERACSDAVARGRCQIGRAGDEPAQPDAFAIVSWEGAEQRSARVQVGLRRDRRWLERTLRFEPRDAAVERWRTVGLAIATLVGELPGAPRQQPAEKARASTRALLRSPAHGPPATRRDASGRPTVAAAAGALVGPGLTDGPPQLGAWAGIDLASTRAPWLAEVWWSYAFRPIGASAVSAGWLAIHAGPGWRAFAHAGLSVELLAFARLQELRVEAAHPVTGTTEGASRWAVGLGGGAQGLWRVSPRVSLLSGAEAWGYPVGSTPIRVLGGEVARQPAWGFTFRLGVRLRLL